MKQHIKLHKSGGKNYIYFFRLFEDAEIIEVLKSPPMEALFRFPESFKEYIEQNLDDFEQPYTITKQKGKWKCTCPWGLYHGDEKPCWHVANIPNILKEETINETWAKWAEEAALMRKGGIDD